MHLAIDITPFQGFSCILSVSLNDNEYCNPVVYNEACWYFAGVRWLRNIPNNKYLTASTQHQIFNRLQFTDYK